MKQLISLIMFVACIAVAANGQTSNSGSTNPPLINDEMFIDMGVKSDNGNTLLWETKEWFPSKVSYPVYIDRPTSMPEEKFTYKDKNTGKTSVVVARYPTIEEWKRLISAVERQTPKDYYEGTTWHYQYPRGSNVYRSTINNNILWLRTGIYFSASGKTDDAIVRCIDESSHGKHEKLLTSQEYMINHKKGYVRRVVEVVDQQPEWSAGIENTDEIFLNGDKIELRSSMGMIKDDKFMIAAENEDYIFAVIASPSALYMNNDLLEEDKSVIWIQSIKDSNHLDKVQHGSIIVTNIVDDLATIKINNVKINYKDGNSLNLHGTLTVPMGGIYEYNGTEKIFHEMPAL